VVAVEIQEKDAGERRVFFIVERERGGVSSVTCRCFTVGGEGDKGGAR